MPLTDEQLAELEQTPIGPTGNRLAAAIEMLGARQVDVAEATGLAQPYVSDVVRGRHSTITVENAHKFSRFTGADIKVLFPEKAVAA
jgi:transcriptional regulator with XRE-family HTH domain